MFDDSILESKNSSYKAKKKNKTWIQNTINIIN